MRFVTTIQLGGQPVTYPGVEAGFSSGLTIEPPAGKVWLLNAYEDGQTPAQMKELKASLAAAEKRGVATVFYCQIGTDPIANKRLRSVIGPGLTYDSTAFYFAEPGDTITPEEWDQIAIRVGYLLSAGNKPTAFVGRAHTHGGQPVGGKFAQLVRFINEIGVDLFIQWDDVDDAATKAGVATLSRVTGQVGQQ